MSADLMFRLGNIVPLKSILIETNTVLESLLKLRVIDALLIESPPKVQDSGTRLQERLVDAAFPGVYVRFSKKQDSRVDLHVFQGGARSGVVNFLVGCGSTGAPASDLLAAALAAAGAKLAGAILIDAGTYWTKQEECDPAEFIQHLALQEPPPTLEIGIKLVSERKMNKSKRSAH